MEKESIRQSARNSLRSWIQRDRVKGVLAQSYYGRETLSVAKDLLGKVLIVRSNPSVPFEDPRARVTVGRIIETEAYHGKDEASHSSRGETPRTSVMFQDPGAAYVYFIYGNYEMLNFVTEKRGYPGAVLIRALEPLAGEALMARRRKGQPRALWTSGPGRLCLAMGIKLSHNKESLQGPSIYVVDDGYEPEKIACSPRVGISKAIDEFWRFFIPDHPFVSRVKENALARVL